MDAQTIREKIVLCETIIDGSSIMEIGGEGITMKPIAFAMSLSFTAVVSQEAANVFIMDPKATIQFGQTWKGHSAPFVAEFYSRGEHINSDMFKFTIRQPNLIVPSGRYSPVGLSSVYYVEDGHGVDDFCYQKIYFTNFNLPC
ncbi:uncharacterized protein LOC120067120 isoform X2 [Benincasa hispida]|uniref:uncharacterized protein LOC120067120 isoform X2 n=1 Tax=Benincasa hispida TaxID=102211 RepID=UPI0019014ED4|nr:uncharacterized protein LOC120067120 isoform X2 [Benincasa hispida]